MRSVLFALLALANSVDVLAAPVLPSGNALLHFAPNVGPADTASFYISVASNAPGAELVAVNQALSGTKPGVFFFQNLDGDDSYYIGILGTSLFVVPNGNPTAAGTRLVAGNAPYRWILTLKANPSTFTIGTALGGSQWTFRQPDEALGMFDVVLAPQDQVNPNVEQYINICPPGQSSC